MILFFEILPGGVDCAWVEDLLRSDDFFDRFREKLKIPFNLLSFPYSKTLLQNVDEDFVFLLDIAWFPFYWIGLVGLMACVFFNLGLAWFIMPGIMTLLYLFWSPSFYLLLFRKGLRKAGFKGKVKRLKAEEFIWRIHNGPD